MENVLTNVEYYYKFEYLPLSTDFNLVKLVSKAIFI